MQTLQEIGMLQWIIAQSNLRAAGLYFIQHALSSGHPSYSHRLHFLLLRLTMSMALCDVNPLMELIKEMRERKFDIANMQPYMYCKVFEDNSGALELA
ncbi:LOW QUALITY PROTEIN: hypothetical protein ACHAW6_000447 [Cyclotella cf. meneghiniana]